MVYCNTFAGFTFFQLSTFTPFIMMPEEALFFDACRRGDTALVEQLLQQNSSLVNIADHRGFTPLILAVYNEQPDVVALLLQRGANVEAQDAAGNTALMGVCFKGYTGIAEKLLAAGAGVNAINANGANALTFAATFGHLAIAEMLLRQGANVHQPDARGKTPLDHAFIQENEPMVRLLEQYA